VRQKWEPHEGGTERGFGYVAFEDAYGKLCSVQESSVIGEYEATPPGSSALWVGEDGVHRMHLSREQVAGLVGVFADWLATGRVALDGQVDD
jgi:hypothetical protein